MSNGTLLLPERTTDRRDALEATTPRRSDDPAPSRGPRRWSRRTALRHRMTTRSHALPRPFPVHEDPDELRAGLRHVTGLL